MPQEDIRGCGFRKVGGIYLVGEGKLHACDRLPFILDECPTCGFHPRPSRGYSYLRKDYLGEHDKCGCLKKCPICHPFSNDLSHYLLMRISGRYYRHPEDFIQEAMNMGISLRISTIPKNLKIGKTWVLLAHRKGAKRVIPDSPTDEEEWCHAIVYAFMPTRIEKLIWESDATPETLAELEEQGITPVIIKDGDPEHSPSRSIREDVKEMRAEKRAKRKASE